MPENSKKVLIISYYFPPSGGAGVQRTLKFVKYLRDFGWEPIVLTARDADYPVLDASLAAEIPEGVLIYRSKIIEPYKFYRKITGRGSDASTDMATLSLDENTKAKWSERLSEWVRSIFFVPDARIFWYFFAKRMGGKILREHQIRVIYSSAPPYTTHLIGRHLHKVSGLPWVADFRDSWIGWVSAPKWRPWFSRKVEQKMESSVLRDAQRILTVSNGVREDLISRNPEMAEKQWRLLPNGFDTADFQGLKPAIKNDKITITYSGSMYGPRNPESLLQALENLQADQNDVVERLVFRIIGRVGEPIERRIKTSSVATIFEFLPYMTHEQSLTYLLASDVLLLIIDDAPASRGILTGKLFEYIGAGKPILALAPDGEAAALVRKNQLGWVAGTRDKIEIEDKLKNLVQAFDDDSMNFNRNSELRQRFERRTQTAELAQILDGVCTNKA